MLADDAIDGAFCVTDLLALGFLDAARLDCGRRVPDDLSVIGFDDIPQAGWNAYQLTTFRQPVRLLTEAVMQVIRQRARKPRSPHGTVTLPATLVMRNTVRRSGANDDRASRRASRKQRRARRTTAGQPSRPRVAEGADAIECDVQRTRDGVLVIRHDLAIIGNRLVAECVAAEVEAADSGLVRLAELLAWAQRAGIGLLVEVKDPACAIAVGDMVAMSPWRERTIVAGFHGPALAEVKARASQIRTSLMMGSVVAPDGPGPARSGLPRGRRASVLGSTGRRIRIGCSMRMRSQSCGRLASRSRCGTRSERANCGRWSRSGPTPSAPTRPQCCDVSWTAIQLPRQRDWPPDASLAISSTRRKTVPNWRIS